MATAIKKNNLVKIPGAGPIVVGNKADGDMMGGINSFMGNLVNVIGQADRLLGSYATIKDKLGPMLKGENPMAGSQGAQKALTGPAVQRPPPQPPAEQPEPAVRGEPVAAKTDPSKPEAIAMTNDKVEKAEALFKELHDKAKPYIPVLKTMRADALLQLAMQPANKKKIIDAIAARL